MKLLTLRFAGFRGARQEVVLDLASGFVIISGRNGTGKSTICDAIEYALTGSIRGSSSHTEKGETIEDYLWWKGTASESGRFVELTVGNERARYVVRRTPEGCSVTPPAKMDEIVCRPRMRMDNALGMLCRTAILRDEEITTVSVDLPEADRFNFVRQALGTADFAAAEEKAREVLKQLESDAARAEMAYKSLQARSSDIGARLSRARSELVEEDAVASATKELQRVAEAFALLSGEQAGQGEGLLAQIRVRLDRLVRLLPRVQAAAAANSDEHQRTYLNQITRVESQLQAVNDQLRSAEAQAASAAEALRKVQADSPRLASLAMLREHGGRVGLVDGKCPLCDQPEKLDHFTAHLEAISTELKRGNERLAELTKQSADASNQLAARQAERAKVESALRDLKGQEAERTAAAAALTAELQKLGLGKEGLVADARSIVEQIESLRSMAAAAEQRSAVLNASRAVEIVKQLEQEMAANRNEVAAAEQRLAKLKAASNEAREASATIRRVQGEYINEQLAQLEPLMLELYQRLRPHLDWPEVRYRLRGDVRKMLSFVVGDDLNPSFVFSSGQRRAAGLAFLLAIHLSRSWCALRTLILDDPVQHIDDYRAVHLTEVLAAIRRTGQQIVCTVEDEALASLLCRRLRGDGTEQGMAIRMAYSSDAGIHVEAVSRMPPLPANVLIPA